MASEKHNFIVSAIARRIRQYGYRVIYLDGKYQDINIDKYHLPPRIINHRPDLVGENEAGFFCIGEAKTKNDITTKRTRKQMMDFFTIIKEYPNNRLIIGTQMIAKHDLERLLKILGMHNDKQVETIFIPEELFENDEEI